MQPRTYSAADVPRFAKPLRFAAVVSTYHLQYTESMLRAAQEVFKGHHFDVAWVPGAFEVPIVIQRLAKSRPRYDALLAFGVVWEGKTRHAGEIIRACTDSLMRIALENDLPVLHEILSVHSVKEVRERTQGKLNRGIEAARAALSIVATLQKLKSGRKASAA